MQVNVARAGQASRVTAATASRVLTVPFAVPWQARRVITAGVDLAAQPAKTGAVVIDWSAAPPKVTRAFRMVTDEQILGLHGDVVAARGRLGIDCPLGWPRDFIAHVSAHAVNTLPASRETDTRSLRLRTTDIAVRNRIGRYPLSVSTSWLGVTAMRVARLSAVLRDQGQPVDRTGRGVVCEVYPAASCAVWGLPAKERNLDVLLARIPLDVAPEFRGQLSNEHIFDALVAALTARAVHLDATDGYEEDDEALAQVEGWIHVPSEGHEIGALAS